MILCSLLIFIVAIALSLINQNIRTILYVRVTSIIFIYAGALAFNALYIQSIGSGTGIYSGFFQVTYISSSILEYDDPLSLLSPFFINNIKPLISTIFNRIKEVWKLLLFLIIISLSIYLIIIITEWEISSATVVLDRFTSNGTVVYLTRKLLIGSIWFSIGFFSYLYLLPKSVVLKIKSLSFFEIFLILFVIIMAKTVLETFIYDYMASCISEVNNYNCMASAPDKSCSCSNPTVPSNLKDKGYEGIIKAGTATAGFKLAQKIPSIGGKVFCGGILAGGLAIVAKNVSQNLTEILGKSKFISNTDLMDILKDMIPLTGNDALDLLHIVQSFQRLQFLFIILICYNILFSRINLDKLESFLHRFLPPTIVNWYIRALSVYQKTSLIYLICFIILLSICNYYSIYYLEFFVDNLDSIVNLYLKKE